MDSTRNQEQNSSVIPTSLFVLSTLLLASAASNNIILLDNQDEGQLNIPIVTPIQVARQNNTTFLSRLNAIAQYMMTPSVTSAMIKYLLNINNIFNKHTNNVRTLNKQLREFAITTTNNNICVNLPVKQRTQEIKGKKQVVTEELTKKVENYMNLNINTSLRKTLTTIDDIIDSNITNITELNSKLQEFGITITKDKICIERSS